MYLQIQQYQLRLRNDYSWGIWKTSGDFKMLHLIVTEEENGGTTFLNRLKSESILKTAYRLKNIILSD